MKKKRNLNISEVSFTYIGTDQQFNEFLKMMVHDYLAVDDSHTLSEHSSVEKVDSQCA